MDLARRCGMIVMKKLSRNEIEDMWFEYQDACDELSVMRNPISKSTQLDIQMKHNETEKLLQRFIEATEHFKSSLNGDCD